MIAVLRGVMLVAVSTMLTPARGALGPQQRRGLSCGPHILRPTNTLRLRTPTPHGHYLVVVAPDKTQFFLVYPQEEDRKPSVIPPDRFTALSSVAFAVDSLRGWPQAALRDTYELVFQKAGVYEIYVADDWETDEATDVRRCRVRYRP